MEFRVRAAAIILNAKNELLLVFHKHPETEEECNIECIPDKLVYVREFFDKYTHKHNIELFFTAQVNNYNIRTGYDPEFEEQLIVETRFLSKTEIQNTSISVYPEVLKNRFWDDLEAGFAQHIVYLGLQG